MTDILPLQKLRYLHKLDLRGNALCELDDYRELIVFLLPKITELDGLAVHPEDTVRARNLFGPNADLCAALGWVENFHFCFEKDAILIYFVCIYSRVRLTGRTFFAKFASTIKQDATS